MAHVTLELPGAKPVNVPSNLWHCNGLPCEAAHEPYEADQPITIKCNGSDDGANWQMAQDIALKYKTKVKIGPVCHIKPSGKLAGMQTNSIVIDGTVPVSITGGRYECTVGGNCPPEMLCGKNLKDMGFCPE